MKTKKNIVLITNSDKGDEARAGVFEKSLGEKYAFTVVDLGREQSSKIGEAQPELVVDLRNVDSEDIDWLVRNVESGVRKIIYNPRTELKDTLKQLGIEQMNMADLIDAIHGQTESILDAPKINTPGQRTS